MDNDSKNRIVENLYADLGFEMSRTDEDGTSYWQLDPGNYQTVPVNISLVEDY